MDINYYKDLISKFDKTILLARKDYKKQCQALWALFNINDNQWHQKYDKGFTKEYRRVR